MDDLFSLDTPNCPECLEPMTDVNARNDPRPTS